MATWTPCMALTSSSASCHFLLRPCFSRSASATAAAFASCSCAASACQRRCMVTFSSSNTVTAAAFSSRTAWISSCQRWTILERSSCSCWASAARSSWSREASPAASRSRCCKAAFSSSSRLTLAIFSCSSLETSSCHRAWRERVRSSSRARASARSPWSCAASSPACSCERRMPRFSSSSEATREASSRFSAASNSNWQRSLATSCETSAAGACGRCSWRRRAAVAWS
mmetsp:Transcript_72269/g.211780  ORF Transcript_72269/g.211780 Transcript_72269/m.211780 type:complete len:229 (-) Transcript_72269:2405-3091(-)